MLLPPGFDEGSLCLYEYEGSAWQALAGTVDTARHTLTVTVAGLSAFALGVAGGTAHSVAASVEPVGSGTITGAGAYADGALAVLVATANSGYAFSNWTESAVTASTSPGYAFTVHGNRTLVAHFSVAGAAETVATLSQPSHGGTTGGDGVYAVGSQATVTATPADGYKFSKWLLNGAVVSIEPGYSFTVGSNVTLVAKFKPVYKIQVSPDPPTGGEIEVDAGYELGELAKPKAVPAGGYSLVNWTENGLVVSTDPIYRFTVSGNRELVAHFAEGYRIDVRASPTHSGSVAGGGVHTAGVNVTVIANANPGYIFLNWTENGAVVGAEESYALAADAQHALVANFLPQPLLRLKAVTPDAITFSWPADATGWSLWECSDLPQGNWSNSLRQIDVVGAENEVSIPVTPGRGFLCLQYP